MKIAAMNQFSGEIVCVKPGTVDAVVTVDVGSITLDSLVAMDAVQTLGLHPGQRATAIVRAENILLARGPVRISARNRLPGRILSIGQGAVRDFLTVRVAGDHEVHIHMARDAVQALELQAGMDITVIFQAMHVLLGVEEEENA